MTPTRHTIFGTALPRGLACLLLWVLCLLPTAAPAAELKADETDRPPTAEEIENLRETQVLLFQRFVEILEREAAAREQKARAAEAVPSAPAPEGEEAAASPWQRQFRHAWQSFRWAEDTCRDMATQAAAEDREWRSRMMTQLGGLLAAIVLVYIFALRPFLAAGRKSPGTGASSRPVRPGIRPEQGEASTLSRAEQYEEWKRQRLARRDKRE